LATADRHTETSRQFLEQAEAEFEAGDLLQASEKAWGAVARYVKAVSALNGWDHYSHYHIRRNAIRLIGLTSSDRANRNRFTHAERLHANFYEGDLDRVDVRQYMNDACDLIETLKRVAPVSSEE
jgi:hypothetical protein